MTSVPRQSLYPGMASTSSHYGDDASSSTHLASLQSALSSLSQTVQIFSHTNSLLAASVADVPRLSTALTSKRHFDVVTEGTVLDAKRQMEDEIRPLLKELIARGEDGVAREEANARRARNKVSQLTTRLEQVLASQQVRLDSTTANAKASTQHSEELDRLATEERRQREDLARVRRRRDALELELKDLEDEVERAEQEARLRVSS